MPSKQDVRARANRLAAGMLRVDDLMHLLLWLRSNTRSPVLRELGDFVAHSETREKGVITDHLRAFFANINLSIDRIQGKQLRVDLFSGDVFILAENNVKTLASDKIKQLTGTSREKARKSLDRMKKSYRRNNDGLFEIYKPVYEEDLNVVEALLSSEIRSAFNSDQLWEDFVNECAKQNICDDARLANNRDLQVFLILYAIVAMHHAAVVLSKNSLGWLRAGKIKERLVVFGEIARNDAAKGGDIYFSHAAFSTDLDPSTYCE